MGAKSFILSHHPSLRQTIYLKFLSGFITVILFSYSVMFAQNISGLEIVRTIEHQNYSVATLDSYFEDGHQLIAYSNNSGSSDHDTLVIYDFSQDQVLTEIPGTQWSYDIRFINSDQLLFRNDGILYRVDNFNSPVVNDVMDNVFTFTVSDDKSTVAMLRHLPPDYQVEIAGYNSNTGTLTPIDSFMIPDEITNEESKLAFSPDGNYIALNGGYENNNVYIINIGTGIVSTVTTPDNEGTYSPVFYEHNGVLRLAVGGGYANGSIEVINVDDLAVEASIPVFPHYNYSVAFDQTQRYAVTGGFDGVIKIFSVDSVEFNEVYDSAIGLTTRILFTQDNQYVISGHGPGPLVGLVIHRVLTEPSGISSIHKKPLVVYPNPVSSILRVDGNNHDFFYVYDVNGRLVLSEHSSSSIVDVGSLTSGIYILKTWSDREIRTAMFVKE